MIAQQGTGVVDGINRALNEQQVLQTAEGFKFHENSVLTRDAGSFLTNSAQGKAV
eukprot:m.827920 g.827920  ORF g.827920 m.827920 type:complete len:55 (+) comp59432_c1_seq13:1229-1393(+)